MTKAIIFDWIGTLYERGKGLFPFSEKVLQELKSKYKLGMVSKTGKGVEKRKEEIESSGIKDYFDSIIIADEKGTEQFKQCMKELGSESKEIIVVGDRASREIKVGNELGCKTFWIQIGDRSFDSPNKETGEPTYKIDSVEELLTIL